MKRESKAFMVIYAIFMVVSVFFFLTAQDIGQSALRNQLIKMVFVVGFGVACLGMAIYKLVDLIKSKGGYTFKEIFFDIIKQCRHTLPARGPIHPCRSRSGQRSEHRHSPVRNKRS